MNFNLIYSAPMETLLEEFYLSLGSNWISRVVKEAWKSKGPAQVSPRGSELQDTIRRRAPLLLYDMNVRNTSFDSTAEKNTLRQLGLIEVVEVRGIEIVRQLFTEQKTQKTTASCMLRRGQSPLLYVTADYDYFDVAQVLNRTILQRPKLNDALLLSTLLSTSLENLTRKGFPVERLLMPTQMLENLKKAIPLEKKDEAEYSEEISQLRQMFPDVDPAYLGRLLKENGPEDLAKISNILLDEVRKSTVVQESTGEASSSSSPPAPVPEKKAAPISSGWSLNSLQNLIQAIPGAFPVTPHVHPGSTDSSEPGALTSSSASQPPSAQVGTGYVSYFELWFQGSSPQFGRPLSQPEGRRTVVR